MTKSAVLLEWQPHRLFPYERQLAAREVVSLLGETPGDVPNGLTVPMNGHAPDVFRRFTYFSHAHLPNGTHVQTDQWRLESFGRSRQTQSTRYSAHGLHGYKGKFNPQMVRAIGNLLRLEAGAAVLDPFCGSGTTLLECAHAGWDGVGLDLNPLAVFIANAKLAAIHSSPRRLEKAADDLIEELQGSTHARSYERAWTGSQITRTVGTDWQDRVPNVDYLSRWFTESVLAQFVLISDAIAHSTPAHLRDIFRAVMSDIVRDASLQDPGDLRIRRRKDPAENYPVVDWFVTAVGHKIGKIVAARSMLGEIRGYQHALEADSREPALDAVTRATKREAVPFDAAITSPPYATALPYIDTQRLSLCLLGLIDSGSIAARDRALIGSREITGTQRLSLESELDGNDTLPASVLRVCGDLYERSMDGASGFRRRNVPALVYRYFRDMAETFRSVGRALTPDAPFALVVGRNRTTLGGKEVTIDTPHLLGEIAAESGFRVEDVLELDTFQRFDVHSRNSIRSESLMILRHDDHGP